MTVDRISIQERAGRNSNPNVWEVRQENASGVALVVSECRDQDQAQELAHQLCKLLTYSNYRISQFTDRPGVFRLSTIDATTGTTIAAREEQY